jgi:uncharacterized protein YjbI with pentapeptide repeats
VVTISGTPTETGTFNYTITLTGGCATITASGTITVNANNTIALTSAAGTNIQTPYRGDHVNMSNKDLRALVIFGAVFKNKQFNNTHLEGTKFVECSFINANFDGASMDNHTEFIKCVFRQCKTDGIHFMNINEMKKQNFERVFQNVRQ